MPSTRENCGEPCALHNQPLSQPEDLDRITLMEESLVSMHANEILQPSRPGGPPLEHYYDEGMTAERILATHSCAAVIMANLCPFFRFKQYPEGTSRIRAGKIVEANA